MGLFVNTNSAALNARRNLNNTTRANAQSFQRLSSGLRINSAKDDAAGLAISERMTSQIRGINQAVRNAGDGISLAQTAEGALQETTNILQRMRELSVQAANDTNRPEDRGSIQAEMDQLTSEIDRIAEKTTFNSQKILDGSFAGAKFHVGANANNTLTVNVDDARAGSLGRMARVELGSETLTAGQNAGVDDTAIDENGTGLSFRSSDGDFHIVRNTAATDDQVSTDASGKASSAIAKAAAINDSTEFHGVTASVTATRANLGEVSAHSFTADAHFTINDTAIIGIRSQVDDADGSLVDAINSVSDETGVVATIDSDKQLILTAEDGRNIDVAFAGGQNAGVTAVDEIYRGGLTLQSDSNIEVGDAAGAAGGAAQSALLGDVDNPQQIYGVNTDFAVDTVDVTTREGANRAIDTLDQALKQGSESRGGRGAVQNRIESTVRNLEVSSENLSAARSRIQDADFATETAKFSKNQIMQQAGVSILAQANGAPNIALSLL